MDGNSASVRIMHIAAFHGAGSPSTSNTGSMKRIRLILMNVSRKPR